MVSGRDGSFGSVHASLFVGQSFVSFMFTCSCTDLVLFLFC